MISLFCDLSNLYYCVRKRFDAKLDYQKLLEQVKSYGNFQRAFAYGTEIEGESDRFQNRLKNIGYAVKYRSPRFFGDKVIRRAEWNVGLTMDVVRMVLLRKTETVILGSSDPALGDLILWIKEQGVRSVVLACGIPNEIRHVADQCIEVDSSLLEELVVI